MDATTLPPSPVPVGTAVAGLDGEPLGHIAAVYADTATGHPAWAAVHGVRDTVVVPLKGARFDGGAVHVPFRSEQLRTAPVHDPSTQLTGDQSDALARHYGLLPPLPVAAPGVGPEGGAPADPVDVVVVQTERVVYTTRVVPVDQVRAVEDTVPGTVDGTVVEGGVVEGGVVESGGVESGGVESGAADGRAGRTVVGPAAFTSPAADGQDDDPFPPLDRQET